MAKQVVGYGLPGEVGDDSISSVGVAVSASGGNGAAVGNTPLESVAGADAERQEAAVRVPSVGRKGLLEAAASVGRTIRAFLFRNARRRGPEVLRIGSPCDYAEGVDTRWKDSHDLWIVRNTKGLYALIPASSGPWPVVRAGVSLDEHGQIVVDRRRSYSYEAGEWDDPASFLEV